MIKMKSICVVGVDGTGKSTVVERIREMFGRDIATVQYMGYKNWETEMAKRRVESSQKCSVISRHISVILEFYHRIYKHKKDKKIVIFDRYVDERILALKSKKTWKRKMIVAVYEMLFGKRFYQPTITFYLTCDLEISVSRKNDINTEDEIERLRQSKEKLDHYYSNKSNVIVIDTSHLSIDAVMQMIKEKLREEPSFRALMTEIS